MSGPDHEFRPGPVAAYVVTGGRTHPTAVLRPETLLTALLNAPVPATTTSEKRALLGLCQQHLGLAEAAAHLGLPVSVVRVLASDLIDDGLLGTRDATPNVELLERILVGLRTL